MAVGSLAVGKLRFAVTAKEAVASQAIGLVFVYVYRVVAACVAPSITLNALEHNLVFLVGFVAQRTRAHAITWLTLGVVVFPFAILVARRLGSTFNAFNAPFTLPVAFGHMF